MIGGILMSSLTSMTIPEIVLNLLQGFGQNGVIFILTLLFAIPLGLLITFGSMSKWAPFSFLKRFIKKENNVYTYLLLHIANFKPISFVTRIFVWIIRGTPLMLQLFVFLYVPGLVFHMPFRARTTAAVVAFVINYAAYFSEIYRAGIENVAKGQYEAGQVLGMTKIQVFFKVVLFQVIKNITPPMGNEVITLVKDTSLVRVIGVVEIIMSAERFTKAGIIWPLFSTGLYFLLFNGILTILFSKLEKKMNYYHN